MDINQPASAESARNTIGQRRYVTVLFSDVSGSSEHAERLEAEEYAELLGQFRDFARDVIPRHGGSIARLQGDGVLALFGFIESREDDGRRACEAALELHAAVAGLRVGSGANAATMQLHSGIHAGLVLLIEGDIELGRFDVVGEVPNTASRLCSLAAHGEIMVSEETLGPQAHFFRISAPKRLPIRGRSLPINAVRIEGRAAVERRIDAAARRGVVPFVGREQAFAALFDAAEKARCGNPSAVVISGEPGIGKTRLIGEFQRRLGNDRFRFLHGYCENYLGAEPLQPFMHVIRTAMDWRADQSQNDNEAAVAASLHALGEPQLAELLSQTQSLLGAKVATAPALSAARRVSIIVKLLELLASQHTLVLVLDDWQWTDDASRQVLDALQAQNLPLMLLLATRPVTDEDQTRPGVLPLRLQPLEAFEAQEAIAAWLPNCDPFLMQEIFRQSGGSPLFIEELCHAAAAGGDLHTIPHNTGVAWINALVASRLARLPESQAECLRIASVAGNVFAVALLEKLSPKVEIVPLLEALAAQDFLVTTGQVGMLKFKHVLTRDAVYATVEANHRRELHLRVAQALDSNDGNQSAGDPLEALSYHYDAAGLNEQAANFAEAAGDKALAAMALDRARAQYMTALRALDNLPDLTDAMKIRWCGIAEKLGQTCVFDPLDVSHGLMLFERAARLARESGHENTIARAEYWLGYVNYGKGRPRYAVRHCEAALVHAIASEDQRLVAQVRATLGQALASAGRYEQALPLLDHAVESKRQQSRPGSGTAIGSAYTLARKGYTLGDIGRFDDAHACFAESLHLLGDGLHSVGASVRELMCAVYLWQGRWEEAYTIGMEGSEIALRCRSRYLHAMGRALASCGAWAKNRDAGSLNVLRESTRWIEEQGGAVSTSLNYGWLVEATIATGLEKEARQHAAKLFTRARAQDRHGEAQGCRALAIQSAELTQFKQAQHYLRQADAAASLRMSQRERAVNQFAHAQVAASAGQRALATAEANNAGEVFARLGMDWYADCTSTFLNSL